MWSIILIGIIDLCFLLAIACAENIDEYINTCYPKVIRVMTFLIPKRYKYYSILLFVATVLLEINILCGVIGIIIGQNALVSISISLSRAFPGVIVLGYLLDLLFYRLINHSKVKKSKNPKLNNNSLLISVGGKVIEQIKYVESVESQDVVVILPWLHNVSYEGNMIFEADNNSNDKYNFMLYNQLINELSAQMQSVVVVKYTKDNRLFTIDILVNELEQIIRNNFSDKKISIIAHGPQAGVEAVMFASRNKVDSLKLFCGGLGVKEYYVSCIEQIISENRTSLPWDKKSLWQQKNAIKNIRTHSQCRNCILIKSSSTFETYCHGFCGKNITQYFGSIVDYSTDYIIEMIRKMDCNVSIIWPEYSIGPWKKYCDIWSDISNVELQIIDNSFETFRTQGLKEKRVYSHIFII